METKKAKRQYASVFEQTGVPRMKEAVPLALQHVAAMIVGCVTPAIIVSQVAGLTSQDRIILVQAALMMAGISTLLQIFPIGKLLGSGLPVILGVGFAYLPSVSALVSGYDLATVFGAQLIGGFLAILVGLNVKRLIKFFPPLITGTVVFTIGLSLYPTAIKYMAGGESSANYGSWQNWLVALITLAVVTVLNHFGKGIWKLASILIGIVVGYIVSMFFGMQDFSSIGQAGIIQLPIPLHFGMKFDISAIATLGILFVVNSVQAIGDFTATTTGGMGRLPKDEELRGGIITYGVTNLLSSFFGGLPTATFSQNVGIVVTTKVINRVVFGIASVVIILAGLFPKFSAILTTIPQCVLGGATISVFASITMTGVKLLTTEEMNYRNTSIVGLSVALGMGITLVPEALSQFPEWVSTVFGKSPVVVATICAILLNSILPGKKGNKTPEELEEAMGEAKEEKE